MEKSTFITKESLHAIRYCDWLISSCEWLWWASWYKQYYTWKHTKGIIWEWIAAYAYCSSFAAATLSFNGSIILFQGHLVSASPAVKQDSWHCISELPMGPEIWTQHIVFGGHDPLSSSLDPTRPFQVDPLPILNQKFGGHFSLINMMLCSVHAGCRFWGAKLGPWPKFGVIARHEPCPNKSTSPNPENHKLAPTRAPKFSKSQTLMLWLVSRSMFDL